MRLGHPVQAGTDDPEELAKRHRALGLRAAFCPSIAGGDKDRTLAVRRAFERHDVMIAEVGVWNNLMDADPAKRGENVEAMKAGLALADEVGAQCVVNIAGSLNPGRWDGPHAANLSPRAFELAVANAREIIDAVNPTRAKLTYEMMPFCLPDSPDAYLELIREHCPEMISRCLEGKLLLNPYPSLEERKAIALAFQELIQENERLAIELIQSIGNENSAHKQGQKDGYEDGYKDGLKGGA